MHRANQAIHEISLGKTNPTQQTHGKRLAAQLETTPDQVQQLDPMAHQDQASEDGQDDAALLPKQEIETSDDDNNALELGSDLIQDTQQAFMDQDPGSLLPVNPLDPSHPMNSAEDKITSLDESEGISSSQGIDFLCPEDAIARKQKTEAKLNTMRMTIPDMLPPIIGQNEVDLRSGQEVIYRAYALYLVAARADAIATTGKFSLREVKRNFPQAFERLSPDEDKFLKKTNPTDQTVIHFAWRYESLYTLLWTLGLIDHLPFPNRICDVGEVNQIMNDLEFESYIEMCPVREASDILNELDLTYRLHWCANQATKAARPTPLRMNPGVLQERHYALNWLVRFEDMAWDDVTTPT